MQFLIGNPMGWWTLAALGGVLLIHLLQQQAKRVEISTLFLLDNMAPNPMEGRAIDRLRQSIPLWLQLIMVLLLTWMLLTPSWIRSESVQRVVIVLDSSLSMAAFHDRLTTAVMPVLQRLAQASGHTEWVVMPSDTTQSSLYNGVELDGGRRVLSTWRPTKGAHDIQPALHLAQSLRGAEGTLMFVSDHPVELPAGVRLLAIGEPIDNVGFSGIHTDQGTWKALVKNYSSNPQTRTWHLQVNGHPTTPQRLHLQPGQTTVLQGLFPGGDVAKLQLVLSPDGFAIDNRLPLVTPLKKRLNIRLASDAPTPELLKRFFATHNEVLPPGLPADSDFTIGTWAEASNPTASGIYFAAPASAPSPGVMRGAIATSHTLTDGLHWHDLWVRPSSSLEKTPEDQVLVWLQSAPLIRLRRVNGGHQLIFNFALQDTNAWQLPAFVILLHRFTEHIRDAKIALRQANLETHQPLNLAAQPSPHQMLEVTIHRVQRGPAQKQSLPPYQAALLRAPAEPAFIEVTQGGFPLTRDAVHFADAREADFTRAASIDQVSPHAPMLAQRHSRRDFLIPLWLLLLAATLVASWSFTTAERTT